MVETIISVVLTGVFSIVANLIISANNRDKITNEIQTIQTVTRTELGSLKEEVKELKEDVKKHNNYGLKIENLDTRLKSLEGRMN